MRALRHVKAISVIERLDIPMMQSNPQLCEIKAAFADAMAGDAGLPGAHPHAAVHRRLRRPRQPRRSRRRLHRHRGEHAQPAAAPLLHRGHQARDRAARYASIPTCASPGSFSMRGHSVGGYGSVTTNKVIATIAGEVFGMDVQAYPKYGSEKKGLPTTYYLTIASEHIRVHSELEHVEFVALNDVNAFNLENPLIGSRRARHGLRAEPEADPAEIWASVPAWARKAMRERTRGCSRWTPCGIAQDVSSRADLQQRMQGIVLLGIFLRITPFQAELALSEEDSLPRASRSRCASISASAANGWCRTT